MRPPFIDEIVAAWGEPHVAHDHPAPYGRRHVVMRRVWAWFPPRDGTPSKHSIFIDHGGNWDLFVTCGCDIHPQVEAIFRLEPSDRQVKAAIILAGWPLPLEFSHGITG